MDIVYVLTNLISSTMSQNLKQRLWALCIVLLVFDCYLYLSNSSTTVANAVNHNKGGSQGVYNQNYFPYASQSHVEQSPIHCKRGTSHCAVCYLDAFNDKHCTTLLDNNLV